MNAFDYLVLALILLVPILIGLYFGYKKQIRLFFGLEASNEKSALSEYLTANSDMNAIPIAFSLLATFVSTNTLLGYYFYIKYYLIMKHNVS